MEASQSSVCTSPISVAQSSTPPPVVSCSGVVESSTTGEELLSPLSPDVNTQIEEVSSSEPDLVSSPSSDRSASPASSSDATSSYLDTTFCDEKQSDPSDDERSEFVSPDAKRQRLSSSPIRESGGRRGEQDFEINRPTFKTPRLKLWRTKYGRCRPSVDIHEKKLGLDDMPMICQSCGE